MTTRSLRATAVVVAPPALLLGLAGALLARGDRDGLGDLLVHGGVIPVLAVGWLALAAGRVGTRPAGVVADPLHDPLTGLANRRLFADRLAHALTRRCDSPSPVVVLYCDVDNFSEVNRDWGREAGDDLIVAIGRRLQETVREGDTIARVDGDAFAVLMDNADLAVAAELAVRLERMLAEPFDLPQTRLTLRTSIGVAEAMPGEDGGTDTLHHADVAMQWAKDQERSTVAVWSPALHERTRLRQALRADLRRAVTHGELVLHYQPTIDLGTQAITGFEALVRWNHPERGLLQPSEFVPVAEQSSLILELGSWVLAEACRAGAQLQAGGRRPSMAVNIAARQLATDGFVDEVTYALQASGLPADRLVLEITETVVLDDMAAVVTRLSALRDLGVRIAIDDFGSGYNSLSYLSQLPVDMLKVDKSFVDQVLADAHGAAVAEGIIAMSRTMNLRTVAEGVELPEQASWLRRAHCTQGQGFLWSRPVDLATARRLLRLGNHAVLA
ncbi:MAG: putative bifunctional diguanylate cyclase/phosphodiesterase [Nocardioides sp.]